MQPPVTIIEVFNKTGVSDARCRVVIAGFKSAGISGIKNVQVSVIYKLIGSLSEVQLETIAKELLTDQVTQQFRIQLATNPKPLASVVEVWLKPGVTDPVGESVVKGIKDLGLKKEVKAFSGARYVFECDSAPLNFETAVKKILVNPLIHDYKIT